MLRGIYKVFLLRWGRSVTFCIEGLPRIARLMFSSRFQHCYDLIYRFVGVFAISLIFDYYSMDIGVYFGVRVLEL